MPKIVWGICRNEWEDLRKSSLITITKVLHAHWIKKDEHYTLNMQTKELIFSNGSKIFFIPVKQQPSDIEFNFLWGYELTHVFVDEAQEVSRKAIDVLKTRCTEMIKEYNLVPKLIMACNPLRWHLYNDFIQAENQWTIKPDRLFIQSLYKDNPFIDHTKYEAQYVNSDKITKERLLKGNWLYDDTPWRLFSYDAINDLWTNARQLGKKYITCDVARFWKDNTVILIWEWLHIRESITLAKSSVKETCDEIKRLQVLHEFWMSDVIVDEDWVGWGVVDTLDCKGFVNNSSPLHPYNSKWRPDLKKNYKNLKTQCYFILADYVNKNKLSIEPDYFKNELIQELDIVVETTLDDNKKTIISKEEIKEKIGRSPDYSDALMMRMWFELRNEEWEADVAQGDHNVYVQKWNLILDNILPEELELDFNIVSEPSLNPYDENYTD